jgi:hypothetical protein
MWLRDDADTTAIDWIDQASAMRRYAETMPPGARREAEFDRALA